jgi:hypothetical protein
LLTTLNERIAELTSRMDALETKVRALHLGSTAHPEWVVPGKGLTAAVMRARIVESVLASCGEEGLTIKELAAYLHIPATRVEVLREDIRFLVDEDRAQRAPRLRWRIKDRHATT